MKRLFGVVGAGSLGLLYAYLGLALLGGVFYLIGEVILHTR